MVVLNKHAHNSWQFNSQFLHTSTPWLQQSTGYNIMSQSYSFLPELYKLALQIVRRVKQVCMKYKRLAWYLAHWCLVSSGSVHKDSLEWSKRQELVRCSEAGQSFHLHNSETMCMLCPTQGRSNFAVRDGEGGEGESKWHHFIYVPQMVLIKLTAQTIKRDFKSLEKLKADNPLFRGWNGVNHNICTK